MPNSIEFDDTAFRSSLTKAIAGLTLHSDREAEILANP